MSSHGHAEYSLGRSNTAVYPVLCPSTVNTFVLFCYFFLLIYLHYNVMILIETYLPLQEEDLPLFLKWNQSSQKTLNGSLCLFHIALSAHM